MGLYRQHTIQQIPAPKTYNLICSTGDAEHRAGKLLCIVSLGNEPLVIAKPSFYVIKELLEIVQGVFPPEGKFHGRNSHQSQAEMYSQYIGDLGERHRVNGKVRDRSKCSVNGPFSAPNVQSRLDVIKRKPAVSDIPILSFSSKWALKSGPHLTCPLPWLHCTELPLGAEM